VRRSPPQSDFFPIYIASDTPTEKIKSLEQSLLEYFRSRPEIFDANRSGIFINGIDSKNMLVVQVVAAHLTNWYHLLPSIVYYYHSYQCNY
jgi:hypothetical protein